MHPHDDAETTPDTSAEDASTEEAPAPPDPDDIEEADAIEEADTPEARSPRQRPLMTKVLYVGVAVLSAAILAGWAYVFFAPEPSGPAAPVASEFVSPAGYSLTHPGFVDPITDKRIPPAADALFVLDDSGSSAAMVTTYATTGDGELSAPLAAELLATAFPGVDLAEAAPATLGGAPGFAVEGTSPDKAYRFVAAQRGGSVVVVSLSTPAPPSPAALDAFESLLSSFAFTAPEVQVKKATTTTTPGG